MTPSVGRGTADQGAGDASGSADANRRAPRSTSRIVRDPAVSVGLVGIASEHGVGVFSRTLTSGMIVISGGQPLTLRAHASDERTSRDRRESGSAGERDSPRGATLGAGMAGALKRAVRAVCASGYGFGPVSTETGIRRTPGPPDDRSRAARTRPACPR